MHEIQCVCIVPWMLRPNPADCDTEGQQELSARPLHALPANPGENVRPVSTEAKGMGVQGCRSESRVVNEYETRPLESGRKQEIILLQLQKHLTICHPVCQQCRMPLCLLSKRFRLVRMRKPKKSTAHGQMSWARETRELRKLRGLCSPPKHETAKYQDLLS